MDLKQLFVSVIVITMLILGSLALMSGIKEGYSQDVDLTAFNKTQEKLEQHHKIVNETYNDVQDLVFSFQSGSVLTPVFISIDMLKLGWDAVKTMVSTFDTLRVMITEVFTIISQSIGLPTWAVTSAITIVMISIVVMIVTMFLRWNPQG